MARGDQLSRTILILNKMYTTRHGVTVPELSREFGKNEKTIRRDLSFIESSLFPVVEERKNGIKHFKLMHGFMQEFEVPFQPAELMSLYFFKDFLMPLEGTGFEDQFRMLIAKIENGIPEGAKAFCQRLEKSFRSRLPSRVDYSNMRSVIKTVNDAVCDHRALEITYFSYSSKRTAKRKIHPYCLYYYQGAIYVIAWDQLSKEVRTFNMERIRKINPLKERFQVPDKFDPADYFDASFGIFTGKDRQEIEIHFGKTVAPFIRERIWHKSQKIKTSDNGRIILTMTLTNTKELKSWVMGFCEHAEVIRPLELREEIKRDLKRMVGKYS